VTTDRTSTPYTTKHALTPVEDKIDTPSLDPLRHAAQLVAGRDAEALEHRIKKDAFASIGRIKPSAIEGVDFETDVLKGDAAQLWESLKRFAQDPAQGA